MSLCRLQRRAFLVVPQPLEEKVLILVGGEQLVPLPAQLGAQGLVHADEFEEAAALAAEVRSGDESGWPNHGR